MAFSAAGRTLTLGGHGGEVMDLEIDSWSEAGRFAVEAGEDDEVLMLEHLPGGRLLALVGSRQVDRRGTPHRLHLCEAATGRSLRSAPLPFHLGVTSVSSDRRHLAYVVHDERHSPGEICFWDLESWRDAGRLEWDPEDVINAVAFSPDGETLATASQGGRVKLWPWRLLLAPG
jgi:WD40 repeat protein